LSFGLSILEKFFSVAVKRREVQMNRLILGIFLVVIAMVSAQYQPPYQGQQNYRPIPAPVGNNYDDPGYRPGVAIDTRERYDQYGNRVRYTRICDDNGCYDRRNGSAGVTTNVVLAAICATFAAATIYLH
jgi:hypothetical protein